MFQNICGMRKKEDGAVEDCWNGGLLDSTADSLENVSSENSAKRSDGIIGEGARNVKVAEGLAAFERYDGRWAPVRGENPRCLDRRLETLASAIVDEQQNRFVLLYP